MMKLGFTKKRIRTFGSFLLLSALVLGLFGSAFAVLGAQEVTGSIQGEVKDQTGAVVAHATVIATNPQRDFKTTTNKDGVYRFDNLQPGVYSISATASGFSGVKVENVTVQLGKTLSVVLEVKAAGASESVTVTATTEPIVDVTSSKIATNVPQERIDVLPKTLGFSSIINVAPGTRQEDKAGGFQIDGASGSENRFVVDGLDVTRVFGGQLGSTKNIPYDFVKEVQIKSAGYEAEFGGATGGVINVVTRSGSNDWHGEGRLDFTNNRLRAEDNPTLRRKLTNQTQAEYFHNPSGKDRDYLLAPMFQLGGPILKDRMWFFASWAPQFTHQTRRMDLIQVVTGAPSETILNSRDLNTSQNNNYAIGRIDYTPFSKLQVYGSFINSPTKTKGQFPGYETTSNTTFTDPRHEFKGGFTPSWQVAAGATWTPTAHLVASFRFGRNYLNDKGGNYDIPTNTIWPMISRACNPAQFNCAPGTTSPGNPTIQTNSLTLFNISKRTDYYADASYIINLAGQQHVFKGGYQRNVLFNTVRNERSGGYTIFFFDSSYEGQRGPFGYYSTNTFGTEGTASSNNQAIFIQDSWQIHRRLTLNLGLRFENEFLPAYPVNLANHPSLSATDLEARPDKLVQFGWTDKLAPRIGAAFDVFGDGRLKVYGSYSVFYDVMKYDLARASGGGEFWIQNVYGLTQPDFRGIDLNNHPGQLLAGPIDLRLPSIGESDPPGIDPNLKPMREHEYTAGADYALRNDLVVGARFTRKSLDKAIDDVGHAVPGIGEEYTIGNPGFGIADTFYHSAKAVRRYTGVEIRVDKRFSNNWYLNASYTYSQLYGNYGGLASSDENGRANPNINRYFDNLALSYDNFGRLANGRLATDRPNTFKFFGNYRFNYLKKMQTDVGVSQYIYQGIPKTTSIDIVLPGGAAFGVYPNGRGDLGRTPWDTQTDLLINHRVRYNERISFKVGLNVFNLWDQRTTTGVYTGTQDGRTNGRLIPGDHVPYDTPEQYVNGNGDIFTRLAAGVKAGTLHLDPRFALGSSFKGPREARISFGIEW
ncbi:MAG TPA: TonB-dependent receptor [Blastocatellia bacterium]|nr:TonB-dependent receptor [Blastocatellia bacterium]